MHVSPTRDEDWEVQQVGSDGKIQTIKLAELLGKDEQFARLVYFEELYSRIPKDPELLVQVYVAEVAAASDTGWHAHTGAGLFIMTHGVAHIEDRSTKEITEYRKGDVFFEPVAVVHRGINPDPDLPYGAIGIRFTSPGIQTDIYIDDRAPVPNRMTPVEER